MKKVLISFVMITALSLFSQAIFASAYQGHKGEYKKEGFSLEILAESIYGTNGEESHSLQFTLKADENYAFSNKTSIIYDGKEYKFEGENKLDNGYFTFSKNNRINFEKSMGGGNEATFVYYITSIKDGKAQKTEKKEVTLHMDVSELVAFGTGKMIITEVKDDNKAKANSYEYESASINRNLVKEAINAEFTEVYGGGDGFRFKVRNVKINEKENIVQLKKGGLIIDVTMEILHDCEECGNAVNQIIVGLGGEEKAQVSVWNGKQRSGGELMIVNPYTKYHALCEDNPGKAEWVKVYFQLKIPEKSGVYYIRTRYAQDYQGNLRTEEGLKHQQKIYEAPLGWWRVDRPSGPSSESNIGAIIVE